MNVAQAVHCLEYVSKSNPSHRDGVILSLPVRCFKCKAAVGPTKSYRPAGTGRFRLSIPGSKLPGYLH